MVTKGWSPILSRACLEEVNVLSWPLAGRLDAEGAKDCVSVGDQGFDDFHAGVWSLHPT